MRLTSAPTEKGRAMSDLRLYRVMRDLEGKHCGNEYLGNLVTCGACKYWEDGKCWNLKGLNKTDGIVNADDFCSYGERRLDEEVRMKVTKHEQSLIHEVMLMAYEQGIEEGRKQALTEIKAHKEQLHKQRMDKDFSHRPEKNTYSDDWRKLP